jgi:uncharacterized protein YkuJ
MKENKRQIRRLTLFEKGNEEKQRRNEERENDAVTKVKASSEGKIEGRSSIKQTREGWEW